MISRFCPAIRVCSTILTCTNPYWNPEFQNILTTARKEKKNVGNVQEENAEFGLHALKILKYFFNFQESDNIHVQ